MKRRGPWFRGQRFIYLQADDVGVTVGDFLHDAFLPVLPVEGPGRAVAVQLSRGVLVAQHVVAHDREHGCRGGWRCRRYVNKVLTSIGEERRKCQMI